MAPADASKDLRREIEALAAWEFLKRPQLRRLKRLADDLLSAGYYADELVEIFSKPGDRWADHAQSFEALCHRTGGGVHSIVEAFLRATDDLGRMAEKGDAPGALRDWYFAVANEIYPLDCDWAALPGFEALHDAYFEMEGPPDYWVAYEERENFALAAFRGWRAAYAPPAKAQLWAPL